MYNRHLNRIYLLVGVILCLAQPSLAHTNSERRAVSVLLDRFETVIGTQSNLLASSGNYDRIPQSDARKLRTPFYLLLSGLNFLGPTTAQEIAKRSESVLVGARDFRPPQGLGPVSSRRCYVFVLSSGSPFEPKKYFHMKATPLEAVGSVWSWSVKLGEFGEENPKASSLYATYIAGAYLVVSNDPRELGSVAKALNISGNVAEPQSALRDFDVVSTHDIWAYRRYRFTSASGVNSKTQELLNRASGMGDVLSDAEALAFWVDSGANRAVLRLIDPSKEGRTANAINARGGLPPLTPAGQGAWEATISLSGDGESSERMFGVMYLFGFGAYI